MQSFTDCSDVSIVIDASNVCWGAAFSELDANSRRTNHNKPLRARPPLRGLVICVNYFESIRLHGASVIAVAPHWWGRLTHMATDDQAAFEQLVEAGVLVLAPEGIHDDLVVLGCALRDGRVAIVTNDLFRDHQAKLGLDAIWYTERRVGFTFEGDEFKPSLERLKGILGGNIFQHYHATSKTFALPAKWAVELDGMGEDDAMDLGTRDVEVYEDYASVDTSLLGLMIGKKGERIKQFETSYGTNITIKDDIVRFRGLSLERLFWCKVAFCDVSRRPSSRTHFLVPTTNSFSEPMDVVSEGDTLRVAQLDNIKPPIASYSVPSRTSSTMRISAAAECPDQNQGPPRSVNLAPRDRITRDKISTASTSAASTLMGNDTSYTIHVQQQPPPINLAPLDPVKQGTSRKSGPPFAPATSAPRSTKPLRGPSRAEARKEWDSPLQQLASTGYSSLASLDISRQDDTAATPNSYLNSSTYRSNARQATPNLAPLDMAKEKSEL